MMEAVRSSGTSVNIYQTSWCYIPEDNHLYTCRRGNLKSHQAKRFFDELEINMIPFYDFIFRIESAVRFLTASFLTVVPGRWCQSGFKIAVNPF
jgi:hypothetical protein